MLRSMRNAIVVALALAAPLFAQESEHEQHHPETASPSDAADAPPVTPETCHMMQDRMEQMHQKHKELQVELDTALSNMNEAEGDDRIEAIIAAVNEVAAKQRAMHEMHANMMLGMMKHMTEHMGQGMDVSAKKEMMKCPMMGDMMKNGMMMDKKGEGSESKSDMEAPAEEDHSAHH